MQKVFFKASKRLIAILEFSPELFNDKKGKKNFDKYISLFHSRNEMSFQNGCFVLFFIFFLKVCHNHLIVITFIAKPWTKLETKRKNLGIFFSAFAYCCFLLSYNFRHFSIFSIESDDVLSVSENCQCLFHKYIAKNVSMSWFVVVNAHIYIQNGNRSIRRYWVRLLFYPTEIVWSSVFDYDNEHFS